MTIATRKSLVATTSLLAALVAREIAAQAGIALTTQANLGFGQIVATSTAGAVTVTPEGSRLTSGGVVLGNGGSVSPAGFTVTGEPNTSYSITLPNSVSLSAGPSSMTVDGFTSSPGGSGNLGPTGTQSIFVGATLHVGGSQSSAAYSGSYFVTASYD